MARDGPQIAPPAVEIFGTLVPEISTDPAPKKAPASRLISTPKPRTDTGIKRTRKPTSSRTKSPPKMDNYTWRKDGAGWELRKAVYDVDDTGIRKRRLPYVAHLSKSAFAEMKKRHKGDRALTAAIAQWVADHDR
jgi:hypothetical protein